VIGNAEYRLDGIDAPEADMGYPELATAFNQRLRGAVMILARRTGRISYSRTVIQAWLIEQELAADKFTVTSLALEAVKMGWARRGPYRRPQPNAPPDLLETTQKPEVMAKAEQVAQEKKLGMFAREGAPSVTQIEAHRAAKKTSKQPERIE
jgi:endonuclease YncB( thermonuclease family)